MSLKDILVIHKLKGKQSFSILLRDHSQHVDYGHDDEVYNIILHF